MAGHTPGPWVANDEGHGGYAIRPEKSGYLLAWLSRQTFTYGEYSDVAAHLKANAHLIAAAPELLDALRAFCGDYESCPLQILEIHAAYRHALTIIAKAEGRQP